MSFNQMPEDMIIEMFQRLKTQEDREEFSRINKHVYQVIKHHENQLYKKLIEKTYKTVGYKRIWLLLRMYYFVATESDTNMPMIAESFEYKKPYPQNFTQDEFDLYPKN